MLLLVRRLRGQLFIPCHVKFVPKSHSPTRPNVYKASRLLATYLLLAACILVRAANCCFIECLRKEWLPTSSSRIRYLLVDLIRISLGRPPAPTPSLLPTF